MDDMRRLVLVEDCLCLRHVSARHHTKDPNKVSSGRLEKKRRDRAAVWSISEPGTKATEDPPAHLRSPSLLDRNTHSSSARCFPYLLPTGSDSMTVFSARPTSPVPPVTKHTNLLLPAFSDAEAVVPFIVSARTCKCPVSRCWRGELGTSSVRLLLRGKAQIAFSERPICTWLVVQKHKG